MFDDMFPFMDSVIENSVDNFLIPLDVFFGFIEENSINRAISLPEGTKTGMPLDIARDLLRPHEMEKLKKYVAAYRAKWGDSEV